MKDEGGRMKDVRAVVLLGVKKGEEMPLGPEKREMADGWWGKNFFHPLQCPGNTAYFFSQWARRPVYRVCG
jgi:hypothetical protein